MKQEKTIENYYNLQPEVNKEADFGLDYFTQNPENKQELEEIRSKLNPEAQAQAQIEKFRQDDLTVKKHLLITVILSIVASLLLISSRNQDSVLVGFLGGATAILAISSSFKALRTELNSLSFISLCCVIVMILVGFYF